MEILEEDYTTRQEGQVTSFLSFQFSLRKHQQHYGLTDGWLSHRAMTGPFPATPTSSRLGKVPG
jgi:hypothetical protein